MPQIPVYAKCSCGQLGISIESLPASSSICHCDACKKRTGSAFGVQVKVEKACCSITGESKLYTRIGDEGTKIKFFFCSTCASTVYWEIPQYPTHLIIAAGCIAPSHIPEPDFSVYETRKPEWLKTPDTVIRKMD